MQMAQPLCCNILAKRNVSQLHSLIGVKLDYLRLEGSDGNRQRVYGYTAPHDGRDEVFAAWISRDEVAAAAVSFTSTPGNKDIITSPLDVTQIDAIALVSYSRMPQLR